MSEIKKELIKELKEIWDNKDFVCGAICNAGTEESMEEMYNYIINAKESSEEITSDEILLVSLGLSFNNECKDKRHAAIV